jgi:ATP phosphoribosyltransferase
MIRVAVPNKGALAPAAAQVLREAGYRQRTDDKDLTCLDVDNDVEFFYLRPRDIATYVASGDLDLGITGRDMVIDADAAVDEVLELDFGASAFRFAARPGRYAAAADLAGARIATSYPGVVTRFLDAQAVTAEVIRLDGAVENAVGLGLADAIADVVDTGATLRKDGLELMGEVVLRSCGVLVRGRQAEQRGDGRGRQAESRKGPVTQLVRRLQGVLVARRYVMLVYDVRADQLDGAVALTPGIESPTISPLHREGWVAVQAMVLRTDIHKIMDELYEIGARAILVTDIHACRL